MKRSERLMFLAGVLCAACAVTFGVVRTKEQKEKIKNSDAVILTIPADTSLLGDGNGESLIS